MRLIDADTFKKQIAGMTIANNYPVNKASALCDLIDAQPTAYDLDKVVEWLQDESCKYMDIWCKTKEKADFAKMEAFDEAEEIVKGGIV